MTVTIVDICIVSLCAFIGNVGVGLTGFGMGIIYLLFMQIATLSGYEILSKVAVFYQACSLFVAQPILLKKADVKKNGVRQLLLLFIPITVISTPLGIFTQEYIETDLIKLVAAFLIGFVALLEIVNFTKSYYHRGLIFSKKSVQENRKAQLHMEKELHRSTLRRKSLLKNHESDLETGGLLVHENTDEDIEEKDDEILEGDFATKTRTDNFDPDSPVYFMIGSQRSGSNWLRTMLDAREDLAGPHPPKIMKEYLPLLKKFGNFSSDEDKLAILIDHICTFVERNTVPWNNRHGSPIKFDRECILTLVLDTIDILRTHRFKSASVDDPYYLLAIMDEIYNIYAVENGKRTWICKAMDMSKHHDLLLNYYSKDRLRYIYLVRDPRDVALSFMKTPEGDCHYYAIAKKWKNLQSFALKILSENEELVHQVRYDGLLQNKDAVMKGIFEFVGKRTFSKTLRRGSVQILKRVSEVMRSAKSGQAARASSKISYKFKNLTRGNSFAKHQHEKWLNGPNPLTTEEIILLESVLYETMDCLGYPPHVLQSPKEKLILTKEQIDEFTEMNERGIEKMISDLRNDDPADLASREYQAEVLKFPPELIRNDNQEERSISDEEDSSKTDIQKKYAYNWPKSAHKFGYLTCEDIISRLEILEETNIALPEGYILRVAAISQRGYYPNDLNKSNQDSFLIRTHINQDTHQLTEVKQDDENSKPKHPLMDSLSTSGHNFFAVYDGHGPKGDKASLYARDKIFPQFQVNRKNSSDEVQEVLAKVHLTINKALHDDKSIDDKFSGTTACTLYMEGTQCYMSNIGDSRCIVGSVSDDKLSIVGKSLTKDHTPFCEDERERIKSYGGRVLSLAQIEEIENVKSRANYKKSSLEQFEEQFNENWGASASDQPRVWSNVAGDPSPGVAFSRSIGDSFAKELGVIADPELTNHTISSSDRVLVVCTDGITEFLSDNLITKIATTYMDPLESCRALVGESYKRWVVKEDRTDDITVIVCLIEPPKSTSSDQEFKKKAFQEKCFKNLTTLDISWCLSMGFLSGYLGGLCGIRGPPIILFFMHSPIPLDKFSQRGTGAAITCTNVVVRIISYAVLSISGESTFFSLEDWPIYVAIVIASILGIYFGSFLFSKLKNSQATIRIILSVLLVFASISMFVDYFLKV